ncbi:DNA polymerase III subunit gamma/tau [Candidatus Dojkabacteria bacterium]|nr:DNA polymerase III subunit gamma/tau [Candidatus Dojkabacteria bacterium]
MSKVLYRKYRSQRFGELIGQEHIASILKNAVAQNQISHAYLFYGPRGLGKTSTARILAKAVDCLQLQPDGEPCCKCENCVAIQEGRFLDLIEIDAASNRGIDQIRELKERIEFSPTEGKYKVYIIDEVHMLTTEAFNALLKTLEEPPAHAILILATTEIHKVPATILSRCQRFDFRLGTDDEIAALLDKVSKEEKVKIEEDARDLIVTNARGSYRDALSLLDVIVSGQKKSKNPRNITEEEVRAVLGLADSTMAYFFLEKIVSGEGGEALDLIQELAQKGVNLGQFVKFVLSVLREILIDGLKGEIEGSEYSFAKNLDREKTLKLINLFVEAERSLKDAVVPTLPLEVLVADSIAYFGENSEGVDMGTDSRSGGQGSSNSGNSKASKSIGAVSSKKKSSKSSTKDAKKSKVPTASQVKAKWGQVIKEIRVYNSHLHAFLSRAEITGVEDGKLKLAVAFDFHKDRIECAKSKDAIAEVFLKLFGVAIGVECEVDDSIRSNVAPADVVIVSEAKSSVSSGGASNIYDSVAEVFGEDIEDI